MLSIVSVNINTLEWMELLVKSIRKFTTLEHEIIIVDNASRDDSLKWLREQPDIRVYPLGINVGHGRGLDYGLRWVSGDYCLVIDIDSHVQRMGWDTDLFMIYDTDKTCRLVAAKGGEPDEASKKPIHPCFMFFNTAFFRDNNLSFVAREGYDVGRKIYYDITAMGYNVVRVEAGYEPGRVKFYPGAYGTEYYFYGKPSLHHMWYGARMVDNSELDGFKKEEFLKYKDLLFSQPLVKEILA